VVIAAMNRRHRGFSAFKRRWRLVLCGVAASLIGAAASTAQTYKVNTADSQSLTSYLQRHRLPLVGAQVLSDGAGHRRIVLFGFVATESDKTEAAVKVIAFIRNRKRPGRPEPPLDNRIEVRPEIARMSNPGPATDSGHNSLNQVLDDLDRFGVSLLPLGSEPK
jgi:hypothetical protein